jgi:hypothetical protein
MKQELELYFDGQAAETDARDLGDFLAREFPDWPARVGPVPAGSAAPGTRGAGTALAIIALVVALPSSIKSTLDLADRMKLKSKLERLVAWAKERRSRRAKNPVIALPPHGVAVPLDQAKPEQLLAALDAQATKTPGRS